MRIILVDDHIDSVQVLGRLLVMRGHHVSIALTLAGAHQLCETVPFDLLLCDIQLPDGEGWGLAGVARRRGANAIVLTGSTEPGDTDRSANLGFAAHLTKPIGFQELETAIAETNQ